MKFAIVGARYFDRGARSHVFVSWLHPYKKQKLVAVERSTPEAVSFDVDEPLLPGRRHFMECVDTTRTPTTHGHDAWRVLRVTEASPRALSMSGENGGPVPPEAHRSLELVRA